MMQEKLTTRWTSFVDIFHFVATLYKLNFSKHVIPILALAAVVRVVVILGVTGVRGCITLEQSNIF